MSRSMSSDSVNLGSNPSPPAKQNTETFTVFPPGQSGHLGQRAHSGRTRVGTEALLSEHDHLTAYLRATPDKAGAPEMRKAVETHRLLTDLLARDGGTAEERAFVAQRLKEIEER